MPDYTTADAQRAAVAAGRRYNAAWDALCRAGSAIPTPKFLLLHEEILEAAQQIVAAETEVVEYARKAWREMQER
jgi:hypothetical protein